MQKNYQKFGWGLEVHAWKKHSPQRYQTGECYSRWIDRAKVDWLWVQYLFRVESKSKDILWNSKLHGTRDCAKKIIQGIASWHLGFGCVIFCHIDRNFPIQGRYWSITLQKDKLSWLSSFINRLFERNYRPDQQNVQNKSRLENFGNWSIFFLIKKILNHPWIREKSLFKKTTKRNESSIEIKKKTAVSINKSKEK